MTIKYLKSGQKVELIQELESGFLVDPFMTIYGYDGDEEEWPADQPTIVDAIFDKAPIAAANYRVAELMERAAALTSQSIELANEIRALKRQRDEHIERLSVVDQLAPLINYLDGKQVTHYVVNNRIETAEETDRYSTGRNHKLLSLFGNSSGVLTWKINEWKDASGSWITAIPCFSEKEAIEKLSKRIQEVIEDKTHEPCRPILETANKYGVSLPDNYADRVIESANRYDLNSIARAKKEIAQSKNRIAERTAMLGVAQ